MLETLIGESCLADVVGFPGVRANAISPRCLTGFPVRQFGTLVPVGDFICPASYARYPGQLCGLRYSRRADALH